MYPLQLTVTWYKEHLAGEQATHWGIQNKEKSFDWMKSLCFLCPSVELALQQGVF